MHLPNGDPVQQHSAGDHYPYVIEVRETNGRARRYRVIGPNLNGAWQFMFEDCAISFATALAAHIKGKRC